MDGPHNIIRESIYCVILPWTLRDGNPVSRGKDELDKPGNGVNVESPPFKSETFIKCTVQGNLYNALGGPGAIRRYWSIKKALSEVICLKK